MAPKTIKINNRVVEVSLTSNGLILLVMKSEGTSFVQGVWTSLEWFNSQLSFPPTTLSDMRNVAYHWLSAYLDKTSVVDLVLNEVEEYVTEVTNKPVTAVVSSKN